MGDFQVGAHRLGHDPDTGGAVIPFRCQELGASRTGRVEVAVPKIGLVGKINAERIGGQAQPLRKLQLEVLIQFVHLRTNPRIGRCVGVLGPGGGLDPRCPDGIRDPLSRPGLVDPGHRLRQVKVGRKNGFDDLVQRRILERTPPF